MVDNPSAPAAVSTTTGVKIYRQKIGFFGWKPDKPDIRDHRLELIRTAGAEPPHAAELPGAAKFLPPTRDQGNQGSCTGHTLRGVIQYKRNHEGQPALELSPRFAYYNGRLIEGTTAQDAGAEIRDVVKGVAKLGIASEALCPYSDTIWTQRPSKAAYREALTDVLVSYKRVGTNPNGSDRQLAIKQAILAACPVAYGFSIYENFMSDEVAADGLMPQPEGSLDGGHAVWMVAYDDTKKIRGQVGGVLSSNQWGADWGCAGPTGQRGYLWTPWNLIVNPDFCDDLWAVSGVS